MCTRTRTTTTTREASYLHATKEFHLALSFISTNRQQRSEAKDSRELSKKRLCTGFVRESSPNEDSALLLLFVPFHYSTLFMKHIYVIFCTSSRCPTAVLLKMRIDSHRSIFFEIFVLRLDTFVVTLLSIRACKWSSLRIRCFC